MAISETHFVCLILFLILTFFNIFSLRPEMVKFAARNANYRLEFDGFYTEKYLLFPSDTMSTFRYISCVLYYEPIVFNMFRKVSNCPHNTVVLLYLLSNEENGPILSSNSHYWDKFKKQGYDN